MLLCTIANYSCVLPKEPPFLPEYYSFITIKISNSFKLRSSPIPGEWIF